MPKQSVDQKATQTLTPVANLDAQAGAQGIALAPPAYGIDLADNQPIQMGGAAIQRRSASAATRAAAPGIPQPNCTGMPDALKSGIEALAGISMDDVRVHYNS